MTTEDWARDRLGRFAGHTARLEFGRTVLPIRIAASGWLEPADLASPATVSIRLPDDAPARFLTDRASLFSSATVSGSAELAETLGFVFRGLRWDVEDDLSQFVGDIVARRALQLATRLARWQAQSATSLAFSVAEYLTEEDLAIAPRRALERFSSEVDSVRDDFARFEKRLERVERR
ncbi:hypothetical protein [Accumulibacter sp.]|uniref:ubiquinone biosynthesis accessory factor UbiJ n=1 Tax=Accumulibacter sp. TaxID=2053492 RepID=UPI0028C40C82|nr:hypothetical protein [Accumulibacter sp.]